MAEGSGAEGERRLPAHATLPVIFGVALATGFSGAVVPGSLLAVVVRETMRVGWSAGPVMMIGHALLELAAIVLLVTGSIRFARSPRVRGIIGLAGGGVLAYLGYQTFLIPGEMGAEALRVGAEGVAESGGWLRLVWLGGLMSMANPYWWLWWATIGAAHTGWAVGRGGAGGATYFAGHVLSDVLWYSAVSVALGAGRSLLSAGVMRVIYVACAVFLLALGAVFAVAAARTLRDAGRRTAGVSGSDGV